MVGSYLLGERYITRSSSYLEILVEYKLHVNQ